jgi:gamma-glutamyltranspeptidase/glutathione hydrolase
MFLRSKWRPNKEEVISEGGLVTAMQPPSAEAGLKMLKRGGNAIDAGVAIGFCNIVVEPYMAALAGLGFMLIHLAEEDRTVAIDFNARSPREATPDLYKVIGPAPAGSNTIFKVENDETNFGGKAITVPATCAGFCLAHELYGELPREEVMGPAIFLASEGFEANWHLTLWLANNMGWMREIPAIAEMWLPGGLPPRSFPPPGDRIIQRNLGRLLGQVAREGPDAMYRGEIADAIVEEVRRGGGVLSREDLAEYEPQVSEPLSVSYRDHTVMAVPTPSGGPTVLETLNILENFDLESLGHNTPEYLHTFVECARHAFADRFRYLGDWESASVPLEGLLAKEYAREIAEGVDSGRAELEPGLDEEPWVYYLEREAHDPWRFDPGPRPASPFGTGWAFGEGDTTHINVVDGKGNVLSCTHTGSFRPNVIPPGSGVYMVGGMSWFIAREGYANSVAGWKRPLVNMAPLLVLEDGRPVLSMGSPGARKIMNRNTQVALNVLEFGMGIQEAIAAPTVDASRRETVVDSRIPRDAIDRLRAMGHGVTVVEEEPGMTGNFARPSGIFLDHETGKLHGGVDVFRPAIALGL